MIIIILDLDLALARCMYVCMYVCRVYPWVLLWLGVCMYVCRVYPWVLLWLGVCMYVYMQSVSMDLALARCMYVCMYAECIHGSGLHCQYSRIHDTHCGECSYNWLATSAVQCLNQKAPSLMSTSVHSASIAEIIIMNFCLF